MTRKPYPSDVTDDEWAFVAPYLILMKEDAPQRDHELRAVFNGLRWIIRTGAQWRMMPNDLPPWYTVYQQAQRWIRAGAFEDMVHDLRALLRLAKGKKEQPLGLLLAAHVTPANEQERAQVAELAEAVQEVTHNSVEVAFVDQGYTGDNPKNDAQEAGIELIVVKLEEAKKGFVLLPRRWVVERSFAWASRFRRLARDFERTPETFRSLHFLAFAILMLHNFVKTIAYIL